MLRSNASWVLYLLMEGNKHTHINVSCIKWCLANEVLKIHSVFSQYFFFFFNNCFWIFLFVCLIHVCSHETPIIYLKNAIWLYMEQVTSWMLTCCITWSALLLIISAHLYFLWKKFPLRHNKIKKGNRNSDFFFILSQKRAFIKKSV